MKRLTLFLKGNVDVHDSLHSCRTGGHLVWNGINEVLHLSHPDWLVRIKHETHTRSDALLQATGTAPEAITSRSLPLAAYPPELQFSRAIFETKADAIILSVQAEVTVRLARHKKEGFLFYPNDSDLWRAEDQRWLETDFERLARLEPAQSMANLALLVTEIRKQSEAPILIYNMSAIFPGESLHCYQGLEEIVTTRIRKFNLGLIELSQATGISIVDVDMLLARAGTEAMKLDVLRLTPQGYRLVAGEVVRVLEDTGVLD